MRIPVFHNLCNPVSLFLLVLLKEEKFTTIRIMLIGNLINHTKFQVFCPILTAEPVCDLPPPHPSANKILCYYVQKKVEMKYECYSFQG